MLKQKRDESIFTDCPRCGFETLEVLGTHTYCVECNFSPTFTGEDEVAAIPNWAIDYLKLEGVGWSDLSINQSLFKGVA